MRKPVRLAALALLAAAAAAQIATPASAAPPRHHPALPVPAQAPAQAPAPKGPPRLIVAIAVDQFSADLFAQYRAHDTGGLARLMTGAVFPSAFQAHAATETCPGHSTLLTGVHPARSGIVANNWYDPALAREDKRVYCAEDESDPASTSKAPVVSARHLLVPTLGEWMKQAWPESRNVAVSAKDRAVMMMGGHRIDAAYWWAGRGFTTFRNAPLGDAVLDENAAVLADLRKGAPALAAPAWCGARAVRAGDQVVGDGAFPLDASLGEEVAGEAYRVSPRVDAATLDLAARLAGAMKLGRGKAPDVLSVSLSATDYIGHAYGTEGREMCIQMAALDRALGAFFARLDAMGVDYAVMLSADHGGLDLPERLREQAVPTAARAEAGLTAPALSKRLAAALGMSDAAPLVYAEAPFGAYFLADVAWPVPRDQVVERLRALIASHAEVAATFSRAELAAMPMPAGNPQDWSIAQRARASFAGGEAARRNGDLYVVLKRAVVPIPQPGAGYLATHGSPWDYDRRVPLLFWRRGMAGMEQAQPVDTVDIAPTLAALIGLPTVPGQFDGRCLDLDPGPADSCAPAPSVPSPAP